MSLRRKLGQWLLKDAQTVKIQEYEGSTALIVQNDENPELSHVFYVSKWDAPCDKVIERLEGSEYNRVGVEEG